MLYTKDFRRHYTKECRMLKTLSSSNAVGQPVDFRSLTLPVSLKCGTERNTVDFLALETSGRKS